VLVVRNVTDPGTALGLALALLALELVLDRMWQRAPRTVEQAAE